MSEHVFALDIGTQSVTGIILKKNDKTFEVCDFYTKQHEERAMLDGQIQNVIQVANIITEVKEQLEQKHGPLEHVSVAAAGRALKTIRANVTVPIYERPITNNEEVKHLELSAVQQAQLQLTEQKAGNINDYHCVGYSVIHYKLDGEVIGSFIDQIGDEISVEVIATFLPKIVVDSLFAALERANLKMQALTLEPIAAIHVLVPESMRRLNVALIDIGAGTSDLAIANDGTITAYGMVPVAGDEITEKVSDHFLLDFKQAEKLKRTVVEQKEGTVEDILGFEINVTLNELQSIIENSVDHLAQLLADKVHSLNKQSPQAVMLIGGGSLTPLIDKKLASYLQLPPNRVAIRGSDAINLIDHQTDVPAGPDFVTPIGIAISATNNPFQYMNVYVNDTHNFLFAMNRLTIGECLIQAGIDLNSFYGKIGLAYFITLNGEQMTLPGTRGTAPTITMNGQLATVDTIVNENDRIYITKGEDGDSPSITIKQLIGNIDPLTCYINEELKVIEPSYVVNNEPSHENYIISDNDHIIASIPKTIGELFAQLHINIDENTTFTIFVNRKRLTFPSANNKLLVNGNVANLATQITNDDRINMIPQEKITVKHMLEKLEKQLNYTIRVTFNGEPVVLKQPLVKVFRDDQALTIEEVLHDNDQITLETNKQKQFIFQDIFRFIEFDADQISSNYEILCNGKQTSFHHPIQDGDELLLKTSDD